MSRGLIVLLLTAAPLAMGLRMNKAESWPEGQRHLSVGGHWHSAGGRHKEAAANSHKHAGRAWNERARTKAMQARDRAGKESVQQSAQQGIALEFMDGAPETPEEKVYHEHLKKHKIDRGKQTGPERKARFVIFQEAQRQVLEHKNQIGHPWEASLNKFSDWTLEEKKKLLGRKKGKAGAHFMRSPEDTLDHTFTLNLDSILPESMDWSMDQEDGSSGDGIHYSGSYIRDQGQCGSCWAVASTAVMEAHLELAAGNRAKLTELGRYDDFTQIALSSQSLVSCVVNTNQCGGTGGCEGATEELAFKFIQQHGMPWGMDYQYTSGMGSSGECDGDKLHAAMVHISNWVTLPVNGDATSVPFSTATNPSATPLLQALVQVGPTTVGVCADGWFQYGSGIYRPSTNEWDINHAVAAFGFGKDEATGLHYWLIKNSWGPQWGEHGFIKLERAANADEEACGVDETPLDGSACLLPEPDKAPRKVCGSNGILSEISYPVGVSISS